MSDRSWVRGWRATTLGAVLGPGGLQTGPFGTQLRAAEYQAGGIPVVLPRDLADGAIHHDGAAAVSQAKARTLERYRLEVGDLVIARRGEVGRSALVRDEQVGWLCGTGCMRLRPGPEIEPRFLAQTLRWRRTLDWFADRAVGQTMANLNGRIVRALPLRLPGLEVQRRVADALEDVDTSLALRGELQRQEEALMEAVLARLLGPSDGGGSSDVEGPSANGLPRGWCWARVHELCRLINGHRFQSSQWSDSGLPILRIQNLNGSTQYKLFAGYAKDDWIVRPGDLLFAWAGSKGSLGPTLWRGPRGVLNQHIFRVEPGPEVDQDWLFQALRQLARRMAQRAHGFKSTLQHLRKSDLANQRLAVPPPAEQRRIATWSRRQEEQRRSRSEAEATLRRLKEQMLDDLLRPVPSRPRPVRSGDDS